MWWGRTIQATLVLYPSSKHEESFLCPKKHTSRSNLVGKDQHCNLWLPVHHISPMGLICLYTSCLKSGDVWLSLQVSSNKALSLHSWAIVAILAHLNKLLRLWMSFILVCAVVVDGLCRVIGTTWKLVWNHSTKLADTPVSSNNLDQVTTSFIHLQHSHLPGGDSKINAI